MSSNKMPWHKKAIAFLCKYFYDIFHIVVFILLTIYVIINWNICVSMQFFSHFDGNNILFLVWILLILLIIYEVEGKGIKLRKHKQERDQEEIDKAQYIYAIDTISKKLEAQNDVNITYSNKTGGRKENESANKKNDY